MTHPLTLYRKQTGRTQLELSALLNIKSAAISKWERRGIPPRRVLDVERITGISRHELRPDLYPKDQAGTAPIESRASH